eukprot:maker-scaffold5_size1054832-snap-gene-2.8 protein:Tk04026 transcript:maker-scaffold5_size1054832-snap-gene-2.8-mRNA-1 annotation:"Copine-8"
MAQSSSGCKSRQTSRSSEEPVWKSHEDRTMSEKNRELRFAIYDWDKENSDEVFDQDDLGTFECTMAEIVRAKGNKLEKGLSPYRHEPGDCGTVCIYSEEKSGLADQIQFELSGSNMDKKDMFSQSDPFFTISRVNPDESDTLVYRSEWIKDNADPDWAEVTITSGKLCNGDWNRKLKFEVFDHDNNGSHDFIGEFYTNLDEMSAGEGFQILQWDVINPDMKRGSRHHRKDYINSGTVILKSIKVQQDTSFLDFIRGGLRMHLVVALDFTMSNVDPSQADSLHYCDRDRPENPYTMAIKAVGDIFQDYDYEKQFIALGFGGLFHGRLSHCFPLNGNPRRPQCRGIDGVIQAYYKSLSSVPLSEPTCYAPCIDYVKSMAEEMQGGGDYCVLLIITDGGISDLEATKRLLVENSHLPMSIILVGLGQGDMSSLDILDDDRRTMSFNGIKAERDIVQFVEMNQFLPDRCLDPATFHSVMDGANAKYHLAKDVLAEIPAQVVQYMQRNGVKPGVPDVNAAMIRTAINTTVWHADSVWNHSKALRDATSK